MEVIAILRVLRRHRIAFLLGIILTCVVGFAAAKSSGKVAHVGEARGGLVLISPGATASDLDSRIADTIPERTTLLADLMTTQEARAGIARVAKLPQSDFVVRAPAMGPPQIPIPLPVAAAASGMQVAPYVALLTTQDPTTGNGVPIIGVTVSGPDPHVSARVAAGVIAQMQRLVRQQTARSAAVVVQAQPLGTIQTSVVAVSSGKSMAAIAALMIFVLWSSAIVVIDGLAARARRHRHLATLRRMYAEDAAADELAPSPALVKS